MPCSPRDQDLLIVTGAAGFIGSHLCAALLARGRRVLGVDNFDPFYDRSIKLRNVEMIMNAHAKPGHAHAPPTPSQPIPFELIEADIRDQDAMQALMKRAKPSAVFHIAALAGVRPSIADPARYVSVNVDGLTNILEAARLAECRQFIFASSSSVYGNNTKVPFAETDPVDQPISPYAATKRAGELICHTYAHLFGMRIAALRFFTVYGQAQRPDLAISRFMRLIAAGEEVPMFGDGSTSRDYTYIDDVIKGVLAAHDAISDQRSVNSDQRAGVCDPGGQSDHKNTQLDGFFRIWNLGSDHPITLAEMIDSIAKVVDKPARIKRLPMQPGDVERTWADLSRSEIELGFHPATSFAEGLRQQWIWLSQDRMEAQDSINIA